MRPVLAIIRNPRLVELPDSFLIGAFTSLAASIYLDDLLALLRRCHIGQDVVDAIVDLYTKLGLTIKLSKSVLEPARFVDHLGFRLDCTRHLIILTTVKRARAHRLCKSLLGHLSNNRRWVTKRKLAHILGFLQSMCLAIPFGRFHLTSLYHALSTTPGWEG